MARTLQTQGAVIETSEAQIAVHWREEEYDYLPQNLSAKRI